MEAETERVQQDSMTVEDTIGETMLSLVVAKRFISRLLRNNNVPGHLAFYDSLHALVCIQRFDLEKSCPPPFEALGTMTSRIERSLSFAKEMLDKHIARIEAHHKQSNVSVPAANPAGRRGPTSTGRNR